MNEKKLLILTSQLGRQSYHKDSLHQVSCAGKGQH